MRNSAYKQLSFENLEKRKLFLSNGSAHKKVVAKK